MNKIGGGNDYVKLKLEGWRYMNNYVKMCEISWRND